MEWRTRQLTAVTSPGPDPDATTTATGRRPCAPRLCPPRGWLRSVPVCAPRTRTGRPLARGRRGCVPFPSPVTAPRGGCVQRPTPGSQARPRIQSGDRPLQSCVRAGGRGRLPGGTPARDQMPPVLAPGLHGHGQNLAGPGPGPGKAPCFPPRVTLVSPAPRGPGQRWGSFSSVAGAARWARRAGSAVTVQRCPRSTKMDRDTKETQAWPRANKTLFAKVGTGRGVQPPSCRLACSVASGQPAKPGLGGELGPLREPPGRGGPSRLPVLRAASSPRPASGSRPTSRQPGVAVAGREDVLPGAAGLGPAAGRGQKVCVQPRSRSRRPWVPPGQTSGHCVWG